MTVLLAHCAQNPVGELWLRPANPPATVVAHETEVAAARARIPSLQHGRRFEMLEPMAEPTHLHVVGGPA